MAALGGGIGASGKLGVGGRDWHSVAARSMLASTVTQGVGVALGMQSKFSWAGVAAAGVSAGVITQMGQAEWFSGMESVTAQRVITGTAGAAANAATRSLLEGTDFGDNLIAALPDVIGQTIGSMVAEQVSQQIEKAREAKRARQFEEADARFTLASETAAPALANGHPFFALGAGIPVDPNAAPFSIMSSAAGGSGVNGFDLEHMLDLYPSGSTIEDPLSFINHFAAGANGDYNAISGNIRAFMEGIGERASAAAVAAGENPVVASAMAKNGAIVQFYASLALTMPDFQWTYVGGFVAHQVRNELHFANTPMSVVREAIADDPSVTEEPFAFAAELALEGVGDYILRKTVDGQVAVVADVGAMALMHRDYGAQHVIDYAASRNLTDVVRGFEFQLAADIARNNGDFEQAAALGASAAYQLTRHEQEVLQRELWSDPIVSLFAQQAGRPTSIYIGPNKWDDGLFDQQSIAVIRPPRSGLNPIDLEDRREIAGNAFNYMRDKTFIPAARGDTTNLIKAQAAFTRLLDPVNHYQPLNAFEWTLEARNSMMVRLGMKQ